MKKIFRNTLVALLLSFSILSSAKTFAAQLGTANVLVQWDYIYSFTHNMGYEINHKYNDITFTNGYSYTQTSKDTTNWTDTWVYASERTTYYRTYRTY